MENYRPLTDEETDILELQGCTADDWTTVLVSEEFTPAHIRNVQMHGEVRLGAFDGNVEVGTDFWKHSGVRNATLHNVTVGDNCLIENIGCHISNYDLHEGCYIANVGTMETTEGATFAQGLIISVLNEAGQGNVILYPELNAQAADLMVRGSLSGKITPLARQKISARMAEQAPERGYVGRRARVVNVKEVSNAIVGDECEVSGASRLSNSTVTGAADAPSYVGLDVICENSIVAAGSSVTDGAHIANCFVGEAGTLTSGFTAESCVFFANSYMANGEACAAFCGPFSVSHHKNTLLIGCQYSFYNAGSGTNFSNHAYKLGPIHYGRLDRGTKTASGAHLLLPAHIGAFSVLLGRIACHPDTRRMPFSYIIGNGDGKTWIVPGRNLCTVGLYRDIRKWPKRDMRPAGCRQSTIDFSWLNPVTVGAICNGIDELEWLFDCSEDGLKEFSWNGLTIKDTALLRGLEYYRMALSMYLADVIRRNASCLTDIDFDETPAQAEPWTDLAGRTVPESEVEAMIEELEYGDIISAESISDIANGTVTDRDMAELEWAMAIIKQRYGTFEPERIMREGAQARDRWLAAIADDADKEARMGDVAPETTARFIEQIEAERRAGQ